MLVRKVSNGMEGAARRDAFIPNAVRLCVPAAGGAAG
jgi:hypothetical protein